jgi:FkbM family methyltransferase
MTRWRLRKLRKITPLLSRRRFRRAILRYRVAATVEHLHLAGLGARTVVDVGANRGQFSLLALELFPDAEIFAFEPLAGPGHTFRAVLGHEGRVHFFPTAIGPTATEATIHIAAKDDSSSFLPITDLQIHTSIGPSHEVATARVGMAPLGQLLSSAQLVAPALLKIDVQGFELSVLEGCLPLLPRFAAIYVECAFVELYAGQALAGDVIAFLRQQGFVLAGIYDVKYDSTGRAIQGDFLFNMPPAQA